MVWLSSGWKRSATSNMAGEGGRPPYLRADA